ncbi:hypothetical protein ACQPWR_25500 [Micromonospora vinacea]|uniref:hypothetical protein n=1 Tax=Micromonospora vinacea TaxID=709878 RepID=UPI003D9307D0
MSSQGSGDSREVSPVDRLLAGTRRHSKPVFWVATGVEALAAASTLASKTPGWVASGLLVGVPAAAFATHLWRQNRLLRGQVQQLYQFDRRYLHYSSRHIYRAAPSTDFWAVTKIIERRIVALRPVRYFTWSNVRRADDDISYTFGDVVPSVHDRWAQRTGSGRCTFLPLYKKAAALAFRIEFDPMLSPGEEVSISMRLEIPLATTGTLEALRRRPLPKVPTPGEAEFSAIDISYPVDDFLFEVVIPDSLRSRRHGLQVLAGDNEMTDETQHIKRQGIFTIDHSIVDEKSAVIASLKRSQPPVRSTYRIHWEVPRAEELGAVV